MALRRWQHIRRARWCDSRIQTALVKQQ